jgi:hypothetical protein
MHVGAEDLELYLLDRLEKPTATSLEAHLAECSACAQKLSSAVFFDQLVQLSQRQAAFNGVEKRRERRVSTDDSGVLQTINPFSPDSRQRPYFRCFKEWYEDRGTDHTVSGRVGQNTPEGDDRLWGSASLQGDRIGMRGRDTTV